MKLGSALGSGAAGAAAITVVHESLRRLYPKAPRMDLLGMTALAKLLRQMDSKVPNRNALYGWTIVGDLLSNSLYYSMAGIGRSKNALLRGSLLGLAAGLGAVFLPEPLGLNEEYSNKTTETKVVTVGLYLLGGLITAAVLKAWSKRQEKKSVNYVI
jgi:hypothetical protein